jgi:hypothetical protein
MPMGIVKYLMICILHIECDRMAAAAAVSYFTLFCEKNWDVVDWWL